MDQHLRRLLHPASPSLTAQEVCWIAQYQENRLLPSPGSRRRRLLWLATLVSWATSAMDLFTTTTFLLRGGGQIFMTPTFGAKHLMSMELWSLLSFMSKEVNWSCNKKYFTVTVQYKIHKAIEQRAFACIPLEKAFKVNGHLLKSWTFLHPTCFLCFLCSSKVWVYLRVN